MGRICFQVCAAVSGFVDAAIASARKEGALRGYEDGVRIARVDYDFRDVLGVGEADVLPGGAGIGALVNAVAIADGALRLVFAGAEPDDVGVLGVDGDAAEGVGTALIEDGLKGDAAVGGLPKAAGGGGDVPGVAILGIDGDIGDTAGALDAADVADFEGLEHVGGQTGGSHLLRDKITRRKGGNQENGRDFAVHLGNKYNGVRNGGAANFEVSLQHGHTESTEEDTEKT